MKECCAVVLAVTHWRPYLCGKKFTCCTDHQAMTYHCKKQETSNMLTRWAIELQNYDFTVKHVPGKLNVLPDMLSRAFSGVNGEPISCEPRLAAISRNVPIDGPYHPPGPRKHELSAYNVHDVAPVQTDCELFLSAVSIFLTVDPAKLVDLRNQEFCPYFEYLRAPISAPVPDEGSKYTMSYFFFNEGLLFRSYRPSHFGKHSTFRDQFVVL